MKIHTLLQAVSSWQAYRGNLRAYGKIVYSERRKLTAWRIYFLGSVSNGKAVISAVIREIMSVKAEAWY